MIEFTDEELRYIEKVMDINASLGGDKISKVVETFIFAKSAGQNETAKLLSDVILELGGANLITKQIRTKIEDYWKSDNAPQKTKPDKVKLENNRIEASNEVESSVRRDNPSGEDTPKLTPFNQEVLENMGDKK